MTRDFDLWLARFKQSIYDYDYYVDFDKVRNNVKAIKIELNILNSLLGSPNIEADFEKLIQKYPETLKCIPILLAVRRLELFVIDKGIEYIYSFEKMNYSAEQYAVLLRKTGLFELMENNDVKCLVDYVIGVETGLDSNARKNRSGVLMEKLVESYLQKAGFVKDKSYFKEMTSSEIENRWGIDLSAITDKGSNVKKFDFVVKPNSMVYAIETNFYATSGSKLYETARSYKSLAEGSRKIKKFSFMWITDGIGWKGAKNNLKETFDVMEMLYNIDDLENGMLSKVLI